MPKKVTYPPKRKSKANGKAARRVVETIRHDEARRRHIPTAEYQAVLGSDEQRPRPVAYPRNRDLDPQLVWRGKDEQDWSDLVVQAPPLYIQEKVHPKVLIDDLIRQTASHKSQTTEHQLDLFADFNGLPSEEAKTEFYQHDAHWANRMILGDSLQVMASLAECEGLRGKVQCIYFDPPYGIKFNSNFQWSTTSRDVKDGNAEHITREPEQVKAFRDTWRDGIHSYLTYLRDRLTAARDLLTDSGSIFVQIGDENVHRVRAVMDEVFGESNFVSLISFRTTTGLGDQYLDSACNFLVWYCSDKSALKYRELFKVKGLAEDIGGRYRRVQLSNLDRRPMTAEERSDPELLPRGTAIFRNDNLTSQSGGEKSSFNVTYRDQSFRPGRGFWKTNEIGMKHLLRADRIASPTPNSIQYVRFLDDFAVSKFSNVWTDTQTGAFTDEKIYVVQTNAKVIERCILMATDPGDLVLDPTCGSGTTATVAEQWGRRWITIDTSRVALALARARIMGARYPFYLLADSPEGQQKEAEISGKWSVASEEEVVSGQGSVTGHQPLTTSHYSLRQGFVYERVPHITLKSIANNAEIDVIWDKWQQTLEPLREKLNAALGTSWQEWEVPRELPSSSGRSALSSPTPDAEARDLLTAFWQARIARQKEIDASIAARAEFEYLYDKPYADNKKVRVAGPFTVESLSPHRMLGVGADDELLDPANVAEGKPGFGEARDFAQIILENLKTAGVQQAHKSDKITFTSLTPWPGDLVCAEGRYREGGEAPSPQPSPLGGEGVERRAAIFIGPEFGTVTRVDLVAAAKEAADAGFDALIACAFNYEAHTTEFSKLGRLPVLKARMNADLHMAEDLKNTGKGNLFVIFGEPDISVTSGQWLVTSGGRMVGNYEHIKELSGLGSLEEINRVGGADLSSLKRLSAGGTLQTLTSADFPVSLTTSHYTQITVNGVDVFHPNTGEVRSDGADGIACWFIDTDYNEESFFVRQAYFLGANDPYGALKTTLKAEVNEDAWATLNSDTSRPFPKPASGRIAVKVINHLGDEVMKVFRVN